MSTAACTVAVSAACLSGLAAALSLSPHSSAARRPRSPFAFDVPRRSVSVPPRCGVGESHLGAPLKSSLRETFDATATYNDTHKDAGDNIPPSGTDGDIQQELQQVLSSPELLDPASILDATIGTAEAPAAGALDAAPADNVTPVTAVTQPSTVISAPTVAISKEEDLELTRQTILKHIERVSDGSNGVVEDNGEDDDIDNCQRPEGEGRLATTETTTTQSARTALAVPSIPKILRYTVPAIGIWLCSPVLSMIDTAAVGLLSGTAHQAALNPAVSVTDYGALVAAFMYTATTNLIAAAVQEDKDDRAAVSSPKTARTLITSLKLALLVGSAFGAILGASGKHLLKLLIGNDALDPAVFSAALRYVRIRSLGMPAMVVIGTAQSACLGMQDVTSPLYVLLAAATVNFLGDVMLVPLQSGMFGGAAGAAWATVASQYAALLFFARWFTTPAKNAATNNDGKKGWKFLWKRRAENEEEASDDAGVVDVTQGIMELTGTSKAGRSRRKEFRKFLASSKLSKRIRLGGRDAAAMAVSADATSGSNNERTIRPAQKQKQKATAASQPKTRGFLSDSKLTLRSYLSPSNLDGPKAREFLPFVVPVTTTSVGRISGYIAMSHVASSALGTRDMAGHQIVFSVFCCLTPFVDALSQVAQSFVPAVFESKERGRERARALEKTIGNFRKVGLGFGAVLLGLVACVPLISRYFSADPIVLERVNGAIPGLGLFLLVHGLMCGGEGTLLGQKDLGFLRNMYAIFFFTVPAYMLRLKFRALEGLQVVGIGTMWAAFSTYNLIRTSIWHLRLAQLQRRTNREADAI